MLSIKINILYKILMILNVEIQSLVKLSLLEDNSSKVAATDIQSTANELFITLKVQNVKKKARFKQFLKMHNYFMSILLTDCANLEKVIGLLRAIDIENNSKNFITLINEVINERDKSSETNGNNTFVTTHIETFIRKLKHLRDKYIGDRITVVNTNILNYLNVYKTKFKTIERNKNLSKVKEKADEEENISNDNDYWKPSGRRVYEGRRTNIKKFPFMASIQFFHKFQCAGAIIKNDLVITSASCLQLAWNNRFFRQTPAFITVQVGSDFYEYGGENIAVQEIYFHPAYDPKTLSNNLAIMRLIRQIAFKRTHNRVKRIEIDRNPIPLSGYSKITIIGWGARDDTNIIHNVFNNKLSYGELDFYPLAQCQEHYTRDFVSMRNFCAGFFSKGGGACNHDAGGPAIIDSTLMGIISFGSSICGAVDSPTVFTKLGFYADWIDGIIDQEVPFNNKRTTSEFKPTSIYTTIATTSPVMVTPMGTTPEPVPIDYMPEVRIAREQSIDDFLLSLYDSDEIRQYYDKKVNDSREIERQVLERSNNEKSASSNSINSQVKTKLKGQPESKSNNEHTSSDESIKTDTETVKEVTNIAKSSKSQSEKDEIMKLIDNLDIDKLLDQVDNNKGEIIRDESNDRIRGTINSGDPSIIKYLNLSETYEEGLSISRESFLDLTLINENNKLPGPMLFELMSLAIEKELKRKPETITPFSQER